MLALRNRFAAWMHPDTVCHIGKAPVAIAPFLALGVAPPLQQIGAMRQARQPRHLGRQHRRLVVAPPQQSQPVQRHRGNQHAGRQNRFGSPHQPAAGGTCQIQPVGMFQPQDQIPRAVAIQQCRAPLGPWARDSKTIIAKYRMPGLLPRQREPAFVTDQTCHERSLAPAGATQAEIAGNHHTAGNTLRRIDHVQQRSLHSHLDPPIFRAMQTPPILTDRPALSRNRAKATEFFLQEEALAEVQERLLEVNRRFTAPVVVTGFPEVWRDIGPQVVDSDLLSLDQGAHDLVIHALSLHWANDPVGQLVQCRHALRPDGLFLGLMFGGQTLHELRTCLAEAETEVTGGLSPRVLPMGEIRDLGGLLQRAGFALPVADSFTKTVRYRDALHLMRDLRQMGEGNALAARLRHPTRRAVLLRAAQLYQSQYADAEGRIPATFEIICLTGWAPADSQPKPLKPGSAAQRLADALNAAEMPLPTDLRKG